MTIQIKTPGAGDTAHGGKFKTLVPLYTPHQLKAQGALSRRYHVSPAQARVIAGFLCMGGGYE